MNKRDLGKYYEEAKQELSNKLVEAEKILSDISLKLEESENGRRQSVEILSSITQSYQELVNLITKSNADLTQINTLRATALDPTTGIDSILIKINTISQQVEKTNEKINLINQTSITENNEIKANLEDSKKNKESISKLENSAKELLSKLENTYQLAINTGLAGAFDVRRKEVETEYVKAWAKRFNWCLIALGTIAAGILAYTITSKGYSGFSSTLVFRLTLLTPLVIYTAYTAFQYQKERLLLEKYAFKSVVASSLESYTELLTSKFNSAQYESKVLDFVLSSMDSIYKLPHEEVKSRNMSLNLKGAKVADLKAEITEQILNEMANSKKN